MRLTLFSYVLCLISVSLFAQSPKTFYIGHSLSDQIPDMLQSLSDDDPAVNFSWVYQSIPGAPLRWQWDRKNADDLSENPPQFYNFYNETDGLPSGDFDILVLTEAVPRYLSIIDETYEYADSFFNYATLSNPNLRVYLYEDWHCIKSGTPTGCDYDVDSNPWRQRLSDDLPMWESVVDTLNSRYNPSTPVCLIPGGQGLARLYDSIQFGNVPGINSINEIFSDDIHLTDVGKYFIACIHFASIHNKSPIGLTNQTQHWWGGDLGAPSLETALKLQAIAWETVTKYPRSCLANTTSNESLLPKSNLHVFPNPSNGSFTISGLLSGHEITISDVAGALKFRASSIGDKMEVDINQFSNGVYFIRILNPNGDLKYVKKVIKIGN